MENIQQRIRVNSFFITFLIIIPLLGSQWIAGPLVNAALLSAVFLMGIKRACYLAFIPSLVAFTFGLMPILFLLPFIGLFNLIFMILFESYKKNMITSIFIAATGKSLCFFLLYHFNPLCSYLFAIIQLVTALSGGVVFLGIYEFFNLRLFRKR